MIWIDNIILYMPSSQGRIEVQWDVLMITFWRPLVYPVLRMLRLQQKLNRSRGMRCFWQLLQARGGGGQLRRQGMSRHKLATGVPSQEMQDNLGI